MEAIKTKLQEQLEELDACDEAIKWVCDDSLVNAWANCHRGDWMLWLYRKSKSYDFQLLTLAKGHCVNTVRHLMKDDRSKKAVDTAIAFGEGTATHEELAAAYAAAADAAADADADAAAAAADADAAAADAAADAAAYAAAADADAADAAAADAAADAAAYAAAADADADAADAGRQARKVNQQATADICRKYLPLPIL